MPNKKAVLDRPFRSAWIFAFVLPLLSAGVCQAKDMIVDGKNAAARDANPGTVEAPFKTIQAAMDKAQPGDTVQVRGGIYYEGVRFKRGGSYESAAALFDAAFGPDIKWLTLEAYKDEHVIVDGSEAIPAQKWEPVKGCKNTYGAPFESQGDRQVNMLFRGGTMILPTLKNVTGANSSQINGTVSNIVPVMPGDTPNDEGWYHDQKEKKLFVNLGGRVPGKDMEVRAAKRIEGVDAQRAAYVRIRKLEVRNFIGNGLVTCGGHEFVVEDNYVHHCGNGLWGNPTSGGVIRRNTFTDIMGTSMSLSAARGTIAEENVIMRSYLNPYKVVAWSGPAIICNAAFGLILRNNVVADCNTSAVWEDCYGLGLLIYGNSVYRMGGDGFYIEASVKGTVLQWNTVFDSGSGIGFRQNWGNVAYDNYFFRNRRGVTIGTCDSCIPVKADAVMYNWLIDDGIGSAFGPSPSKDPAQIFDHNVYKFLDWPDADLKEKKPLIARIEKNINVPYPGGCPVRNGVCEWPGTSLQKDFGINWTGVIKIEKEGEYKFYGNADNGSRVFIDGKLVVNNAGMHGTERVNDGRVTLKAGNHEFKVDYYFDCGVPACVVSWEPPGRTGRLDQASGAKAVIPESVFFHQDSAGGELQPGLKAEYFDIAGASMPFDQSKPVILQYGDKQYMDLATLRAEVGQEIHGKVVTEFDPAPIGLVTFRVPGTQKSWKPVPMIGNPAMDRQDAFQSGLDCPYFWKKGSFQGVEPYGWRGAGNGWNGEGCGFASVTRGDGTGFMRSLFACSIKSDKGPFDDPMAIRKFSDDPAAIKDVANDGLACLQIASYPPDKTISSDGYGFWSVDMPTMDGAQIDLSAWVMARNVKAARPASISDGKMAGRENGGLYVLAEFHDETGQNVSRQYLVGAGDTQKAVGADWMTGDHKYKQLTGRVTAPKGARWFKVGFGLRNCTGWMALSNIDIQTRPGTPEAEVKRVLPIDPKQFTWTPCDLSGLFNRPLADEVDNDGKGGWTDQGPLMDMRNLQAGDYTWNDVAFRVAKGNACFIMKNKHRPSQNLPDGGKVDLKGKADVLAFLHSGGWIDADVQEATYIVHYADGAKAEIPVIGGRNILDWTTPPDQANEVKYDPALGLILPATSVASPQFVHVTVWMVLWKNPHPDKPIAALEVKGRNEGIPGLLGVSLGRLR